MEAGRREHDLSSLKESIERILSANEEELKKLNVRQLMELQVKVKDVLIFFQEKELQMLRQQIENFKMRDCNVLADMKKSISEVVDSQLRGLLARPGLSHWMIPQAADEFKKGLNEGLLLKWSTKLHLSEQRLDEVRDKERKLMQKIELMRKEADGLRRKLSSTNDRPAPPAHDLNLQLGISSGTNRSQ